MPVRSVIQLPEKIIAAIWDITETEEELLRIARPDLEEMSLYRTFRHPGRKLQWLAVRALIKTILKGDPARIIYNSNGKPHLGLSDTAISISHTAGFAAIALSEAIEPGIDIELVQPRLRKIAGRFLNEAEQERLPEVPADEQLCMFWCIKEAVFKIHGEPGLDLRNQIHVLPNDYFCTFPDSGVVMVSVSDKSFRHTFHVWLNNGLMMAVCY